MNARQLEAVKRHGEQLNAIFHTGLDPVVLCKKLRRIEGAAHKLAEDACNSLSMESKEYQSKWASVQSRLWAVLQVDNPGNKWQHVLHINMDPRGYALKIDDEYMRAHNITLYRDMGGYGILAPEFDKDGRQ